MAASYKNPPQMRDGLLYDDWKKELKIWCSFTDLDKKRQGPAVFLTLKGKARESVLADIESARLQSEDGVQEITKALDKLYERNKSESAFAAFENFIHFKRPHTMSIKDYTIDFNLRLSKIKSHKMDLPDGVLAYYLLHCANLSVEQTSLCRATCSNLTYEDMKKQIERVSVSSESPKDNRPTSQVTVEPQYLAQYDEQYDPHDYAEEGESAFWDGVEENAEVDETYYNRHGSNPGSTRGGHFSSNSNPRKQRNPPDQYGNPTPCNFCKSIYHWVDKCPDAPAAARNSRFHRGGSSGYQRRGVGYPGRGRGRARDGAGYGNFNNQYQF